MSLLFIGYPLCVTAAIGVVAGLIFDFSMPTLNIIVGIAYVGAICIIINLLRLL